MCRGRVYILLNAVCHKVSYTTIWAFGHPVRAVTHVGVLTVVPLAGPSVYTSTIGSVCGLGACLGIVPTVAAVATPAGRLGFHSK